jgi:uncharacterized protein YodC (DUF2158 family)
MRVGDKVRLKAGGPLMTVESVKETSAGTQVHCVWFDHDHNERRAQYPEAALEVPRAEGRGA